MSILSFLRGLKCVSTQDAPNNQNSIPPFGEPDDIIIINPTRINESDSIILYYKEKNLFFYNTSAIPINEIRDITACNGANAYIKGYYQIVITLNNNEKYYIPVGDDQETLSVVLSSLFEKMDCSEH